MKNRLADVLTKDFLNSEYLLQSKSATQIAKENNCTMATVLSYLRYYGFTVKRRLPKNIKNQRFGKLIAIDCEAPINPGDKSKWLCVCDCGNKTISDITCLTTGIIKCCKECSTGPGRKNYYGNSVVSLSYFNDLKRGAIDRGIEWNVSLEDLEIQFKKQQGLCYFSKIELIPPVFSQKRKEWTASVDRLDSDIGYVRNNVVWVHKDINRMKWHYEVEYFVELCKRVSENYVKNSINCGS